MHRTAGARVVGDQRQWWTSCRVCAAVRVKTTANGALVSDLTYPPGYTAADWDAEQCVRDPGSL
jgi:hypothetical protein